MRVISIVVTCLILIATGGYVLWQYHTAFGLGGGLFCIYLALGIAFPTNIGDGTKTLKLNISSLGPVMVKVFTAKNKADADAPPPAEDQ